MNGKGGLPEFRKQPAIRAEVQSHVGGFFNFQKLSIQFNFSQKLKILDGSQALLYVSVKVFENFSAPAAFVPVQRVDTVVWTKEGSGAHMAGTRSLNENLDHCVSQVNEVMSGC